MDFRTPLNYVESHTVRCLCPPLDIEEKYRSRSSTEDDKNNKNNIVVNFSSAIIVLCFSLVFISISFKFGFVSVSLQSGCACFSLGFIVIQ